MHHHHHYVASPTSTFSESSSQYFEGSVTGIPATAANELTIRIASPIPSSTTSTPTNYPVLGPTCVHAIQPQGFVQNSSQSLVHGTSHRDADVTQKYLRNVLWLKNQIDNGVQQNVDNTVGKEKEITGKDISSPNSSPSHPSSSERKPQRYTKSFLWQLDNKESFQNGVPEDDLEGGKSKSRKTDDSSLVLDGCEATRPYNSPSEDNSITEDSNPALSVAPTIPESSSVVPSNTRNTRKIAQTDGEVKGRNDGARVPTSQTQDSFISGGCAICPSCSNSTGPASKLEMSDNFCRDDTASSLDDDSVRSSEKRIAWTYNSSCTESESPRKETSSLGRPAKKSCGERACRWQASMEVRAWDNVERRPRKSFCEDETEDIVCAHGMDSVMKIEEKARISDNKERGVPVGRPQCPLDTSKEKNGKGDVSKPRVQGFGRQNRIQPELKEVNVTQDAETMSNTSFGKKRGLQQILSPKGKNGTDKQILEFLHDQEFSTSARSPRVEESKLASHNKLREALEAAWKTSLMTKMGFGEPHAGGALQCEDRGTVKDQWCEKTKLDVNLKQQQSFTNSAKEKIRLYETAWKASIGKIKGVEDVNPKNAASDHVLRDIQRDHENLKVLVAREENLQRELKDQTVARITAEERARLAAEQKAQIYEASAKAAEEGLRVLLDERALFHSKFKEELEQGATDRLRLQELLQLEKLKLEATEAELRDVRRSLQDSLAVGIRANKNSQQDTEFGMLSLHSCTAHGIGAGRDEAHLKLIAESENRIAAEAKASYFEASAKAAEGRLRKLLDERNWFFLRFKEELEHKTTNMIKLQQLMEMEKANHEPSDPPRKRQLDVKSSMASRVANESQNNALKEETDGHRLKQLLELEGQSLSQDARKGNAPRTFHQPGQNSFSYKEGEEGLEENPILPSSVAKYDKRDLRNENLIVKNDMIPTRVWQWESDALFSVKIERCGTEGGETATAVDISPGKGRFNSAELDLGENLHQSSGDFQLGPESVEDIFDVRSISNLATNQSAEQSSDQPMSKPAKWKKETKAELRRMIQEQEMTWRIAEDAVEELGRRLELLEKYKMDIQDTLRSRAMGSVDCFLTRLEEKLEDFPRGFNSFYNSPIYEERKGGTGISQLDPAQPRCISPTRVPGPKDYEIQRLNAENAHLKKDLLNCESKRSCIPAKQNDFQSSPQAPTPPEETPAAAAAGVLLQDLSTCPLSGFDVHLTETEYPQLNHGSEGFGRDIVSELPDDPFEEIKSVATKSRQNGWMDYPERINIKQSNYFSHTRQEPVSDSRSWISMQDEENEQISTQSEEYLEGQMGYSSAHYGEDNSMVSVNPSPDQGEMNVLKGAVLKLSNIFWEQEGRLKKFKDAATKKANEDSSQTIDLWNFYVELLKEMSQQLGELCSELQASTQSCQEPHCTEMMDTSNLPAEYLREQAHDQTQEGGINQLLAERLNSEVEKLSDVVTEHEYGPAQMGNLQTALNMAEKRIEEEVNINILLKEKLESASKYLSKFVEDHAQEVARKDQNITLVQQLNVQLANDMSQTEKSLAELQSRYKGLVATLEGQLQEVRNEVEISAKVMEKTELTKTFQAMKKEADVQNHRIIELVSINEDLIAFSHTKEDEITTLVKTVKSLQQNLQDKTDEASKMAVEAVKFSQGVVEARKEAEAYRLHSKVLESKLEETEQELTAREDSLERLTRHLGKTIEGQDLILAEKEQLLLSLNKAQYKEHRMDDQLRQSKIVIQDLEDKISSMDVEIHKARIELADMKAKGEEALAIERQAGEMRNRVHRLEEEIMEKEGQISILKASFPGKYDSTY